MELDLLVPRVMCLDEFFQALVYLFGLSAQNLIYPIRLNVRLGPVEHTA